MGSPPAELITMHLLVLTLLCLTSATLALVHYPNGAAVPYNGALIAATNAHLASKGYLGFHPGYYLGRKKREADAQVYPLAYGYPYTLPYAVPVAPFVAHPNGAVVPLEPKDVVEARADHLAAHAAAGRRKREADPLVHYPNGAAVPYNGALIAATNNHLASKGYLGYYNPYFALGRKKREADAQYLPLAYGYPYHLPYAVPVAPFVAHPNGAVVPLEPKDVVEARADHLAAHAAAVAEN